MAIQREKEERIGSTRLLNAIKANYCAGIFREVWGAGGGGRRDRATSLPRLAPQFRAAAFACPSIASSLQTSLQPKKVTQPHIRLDLTALTKHSRPRPRLAPPPDSFTITQSLFSCPFRGCPNQLPLPPPPTTYPATTHRYYILSI